MLAKLKAVAAFVYNWITVLVGSIVGVIQYSPDFLLDFLNAFAGIDVAPLVGTPLAVKIVSGVAIAKALLAFVVAQVQARKAA